MIVIFLKFSIWSLGTKYKHRKVSYSSYITTNPSMKYTVSLIIRVIVRMTSCKWHIINISNILPINYTLTYFQVVTNHSALFILFKVISENYFSRPTM